MHHFFLYCCQLCGIFFKSCSLYIEAAEAHSVVRKEWLRFWDGGHAWVNTIQTANALKLRR